MDSAIQLSLYYVARFQLHIFSTLRFAITYYDVEIDYLFQIRLEKERKERQKQKEKVSEACDLRCSAKYSCLSSV